MEDILNQNLENQEPEARVTEKSQSQPKAKKKISKTTIIALVATAVVAIPLLIILLLPAVIGVSRWMIEGPGDTPSYSLDEWQELLGDSYEHLYH